MTKEVLQERANASRKAGFPLPQVVDSIFDTVVVDSGSGVSTGESTGVSGVMPFSSRAAAVRILNADPGAYRFPAIARFVSGCAGSATRAS